MKRVQKVPMKPSVALAKLQELCARSEQCSHEVMTKLAGWGITPEVSRKILALLKRDRYVDDRRYAAAFVRDKVVFNRWGRNKIKLALITKRLDSDLIAEAMDEIDPDEYRGALVEVVRNKARMMAETESYESRTKILKHAVSRGFEVSMALEIIKNPELWRC